MKKPRPSSLPKLKLCGQFESAPGTSEAAERGLKLDAALRSAWETRVVPPLEQTDAIAVAWAFQKLEELANGMHVTMAEEQCKIDISALDGYVGTADAICLRGAWHADLKTGQIYDYEPQMAAYALGLMEETGFDEWTSYLLFADQQKVFCQVFTRDEAQEIVDDVLANVGTAPTPNEYCGWCAKSLTCEARVEAQSTALATTQADFSVILNNADRLGDFLARCKIFDDFREAAEAKAREMLTAGQAVPGWKLGTPRARKTVDLFELWSACPEVNAGQMLKVAGSISLKDAQQIADKVPDHLVQVTYSKAPLQQAK